MGKRYIMQRLKVTTDSNLKIKTQLMNRTLQNLGVKGKINKIDVVDMLSRQPLFMSDKEIADLAKRRITKKIRI